MRASSLIVLIGFLSLTVSCAHQKIDAKKEVAKSDVKIVKQIETKKDTTKLEKKEAKKELVYTCLVGKDKRTIRLDKNSKSKKCEVEYTKFGDKEQVAWAQATPAICERAYNSIRSNIEGAGYKCADGMDVKLDKKDKKEELKKARETAAAKMDTKPATPKK